MASETERFWAKVNKDGPIPTNRPELGSCWIWAEGRSKAGYGKFYVNPQVGQVYAHRYAYEAEYGPIPPGLQCDHLCRNRSCARPTHLEAVTQAVNKARGISGALSRERALAQTHCVNGHERNARNTATDPRTGANACRVCARARASGRDPRSEPDEVLPERHVQRRKVACPQGHPYDDANTYVYRGHRKCKECSHARSQEWRARAAVSR